MSIAPNFKIVVTGASGFLGQVLGRLLLEKKIPHILVSRRVIPGGHQVSDYTETPVGAVLVHLAEDSHIARVNDQGVNYEMRALQTLNELIKKGYKKIIYASSGALYGDLTSVPHSVGDEVVTNTTYLRVKRGAEKLVLENNQNVVVRLGNIYGPGMSQENVISTIFEQLRDHGEIRVRDDRPRRDFLWVEDAAEAIVKFALSSFSGVFNLGSGIGFSVRDVAQMASEIVGRNSPQIIAYEPAQRESNLILDISQTSAETGWSPKTSLREGLERMLKEKMCK